MSHPDAMAARAADRARVVAIAAEIDQFEQRIRALQVEQDFFQHRLDAYEYPVLTLPNEIVSEIFIHFLPTYPHCPPMKGRESPTTLTHICRRWHEIALATPKLWRAIAVFYTQKRTKQTRLVQTWLNRSGSCPLSIRLGPSDLVSKEAFLAILLHSERWHHVELGMPAPEVALIKGPMPLLESFSLEVDRSDYTHPATTFGDFPRLRSLTLDNAGDARWLPISQLTTLTFQDVHHLTNCLPLLRDAVNLVHLSLIDCTIVPPQSNNITLTRVQTFAMIQCLAGPHMLDILTLPALCTLRMPAGGLGLDPINSLTSFISRSGCKLQKVVFTRPVHRSEKSLLAAFPTIPHFQIKDDVYSMHSQSEAEDDSD
ncbi:hypothetical protein FB45DRAFT_1053769 [Roridomyces roridus]|uniref:F-box domain-containing protein n=1 Tax=Roridomyces roridus TaxID=1738132 RepID=A0AAD7C7E7_9AGAR|nr:hypothetical protein FB45DRAFT_1053769 [Roridomyces roridus]